MALEDLTGTGKFISSLNPAWPVDDDWVDEGDNHIRGIKNVLRNTFPNVDGAVSVTDEQLNAVGYAPRKFIGRFAGLGSAFATVLWGAGVASDPKLVAMSAEIEQVVPAANAGVALGFYTTNASALFGAINYHVGMGNNSGAVAPVGTVELGVSLMSLGTALADATAGLGGRVWWGMQTGGAILRGTYDVYVLTPSSQIAQVRGSFQVTTGARPGGIALVSGGGGVNFAVIQGTVWGHYIP